MRIAGFDGCCGARTFYVGAWDKFAFQGAARMYKQDMLGNSAGIVVAILTGAQRRCGGKIMEDLGFEEVAVGRNQNPGHGANLYVYVHVRAKPRKRVKVVEKERAFG